MKFLLLLLFAFALVSCKKDTASQPPVDDGISAEIKQQAAALQVFVKTHNLQLSKYYSDVPIDYIDTDNVVKAETELWPYVSPWLVDDRYVFNDKEVHIEQNALKIPSDNSDVIVKSYEVKMDKTSVILNFVGHEYQYVTYRLINFNDTMLLISGYWHDDLVKSEFRVLK